jgi:hypothetical protein
MIHQEDISFLRREKRGLCATQNSWNLFLHQQTGSCLHFDLNLKPGIHKFHHSAQDHQNVENSCHCRAWATSLLTLLFEGRRHKSEDGVETSKAKRDCNMIANVKVVYATW